jgi:hypothetical protein
MISRRGSDNRRACADVYLVYLPVRAEIPAAGITSGCNVRDLILGGHAKTGHRPQDRRYRAACESGQRRNLRPEARSGTLGSGRLSEPPPPAGSP